MKSQTIAIACDHAGFPLKRAIHNYLVEHGYKINDLGTNSEGSVDYPEFGFAMAKVIDKGLVETGVLVCGSGIGISIAANRNPKVRAALIHDALGARTSRQHNNANVLVLGSRLISEEEAIKCLLMFFNTNFEGDRHQARLDKFNDVKI